MFHMAAFGQAKPQSVALSVLPAILDGWAEVQNDRLVLQQPSKIIAAVAVLPTGTRAQIDSANFREVAPIELVPILQSVSISANLSLPFYPPAGKSLPRLSGVSVLTDQPSGSASQQFAAIWFGDTPTPSQSGEVWTIQAQVTVTSRSFRWTPAQVSFSNQLPPGIYTVVGMTVINNVAFAARLRFQSQQMMPGCLCVNFVQTQTSNEFRRGMIGRWGTFKYDLPPQLEVLAPTSTLLVLRVILDLVKES